MELQAKQQQRELQDRHRVQEHEEKLLAEKEQQSGCAQEQLIQYKDKLDRQQREQADEFHAQQGEIRAQQKQLQIEQERFRAEKEQWRPPDPVKTRSDHLASAAHQALPVGHAMPRTPGTYDGSSLASPANRSHLR